jgi:hypothetical protein
MVTASPEAAKEIAWPMVRQAAVAYRQLLVSLPVNPLTYHVVLARASGARASSSAVVTTIELQVRVFMVVSSELQGPSVIKSHAVEALHLRASGLRPVVKLVR